MFKSFKQCEFFRLISFMHPRVLEYFSSLIAFSISGVGMSIIIAFVFKNVIETAQNTQIYKLSESVVIVSITILLLIILTPVFRYIFVRCVKLTMAEIRLQVFSHIEKLPISYHEKRHSGDLMSRLTNDMQVVEEAYMDVIYSFVSGLITGIFTVTAMIVLNWMVALILFIAGIAFAYVLSKFSSILYGLSVDIQNQRGKLIEQLKDILEGIQIIKTFQIGSILQSKFEKQNSKVALLYVKRTDKTAVMEGTNYFLNMLSFGGIIAVGCVMVANNIITFGTLTAIIILQSNLEQLVFRFGQIISNMQKSMAGASRLFEILNEHEENESGTYRDYKGDKRNSDTVMIEMSNVKFIYEKGKFALNGLYITAEKGKVTAIVGPSGGGKSTVAKLLLRFFDINSGGISIDGKPIESYTLDRIREMIAYVPQDSYLFNGTIEENIGYGKPEATREEIIDAAQIANAHEFIMKLSKGYSTQVGQAGAGLSGGQRQMVAIARAILKNAPIILLDEATSAMDVQSEKLIQGALGKLIKGRTVLVIAHRLSTIRNADFIYTIDDGKVVESGKHEELMAAKGLYSHLYSLQFKDAEVTS